MVLTISEKEFKNKLLSKEAIPELCLIKTECTQGVNTWLSIRTEGSLFQTLKKSPEWPNLETVMYTDRRVTDVNLNEKPFYWKDSAVVANSPAFVDELKGLERVVMEIHDMKDMAQQGPFIKKTNKAVEFMVLIGEAGSTAMPHYDGDDTFVLVLKGKKKVETETDSVEMGTADLLYISKTVKHKVLNLSNCVSIFCTVKAKENENRNVPVFVPPVGYEPSIPRVILDKVFAFFTPPELGRIGIVSKEWHHISSQNYLWSCFVPSAIKDILRSEAASHPFIFKERFVSSLYHIIKSKHSELVNMIKAGTLTTSFLTAMLLNPPAMHEIVVKQFLGNMDRSIWGDLYSEVHEKFLQKLDLAGKFLPEAVGIYLSEIHLPGEAPKIDRLIEHFAIAYCKQNPGFSNSDAAYVMSYSIIMLNTDLYSPLVRTRMTRDQFIRSNRGIDSGVPPTCTDEFVGRIYDYIAENPLEIDSMRATNLTGTSQPLYECSVQVLTGVVLKKWQYSWLVVCAEALYFLRGTSDTQAYNTIPLKPQPPAAITIKELKEVKELHVTFNKWGKSFFSVAEKTNLKFTTKKQYDKTIECIHKYLTIDK